MGKPLETRGSSSLLSDLNTLDRDAWMRRGIIVLVILVAGFMVPEALRGEQLDLMILGLIPVLIGTLVLIRWPQVGFPLLVVANFLVPSLIGTGTETSISISIILTVVLLVLWLIEKMGKEKKLELANLLVVPPLLVLMGVSVLSFGFGQIRWLPAEDISVLAQLGGLSLFVILPALFLLAMDRVRDIRMLKITVWLFIILGAGFILLFLLPNMRQYGMQVYQRAVFDSMFWTWIIVLSVSQSLLNNDLNPIARLALGGVAIGAFYSTIVVRQAWTSGWFPAILALMAMFTVRRPKWAVIGGLLLGVVLLLRPEILETIFLTGDNEYSLSTRLEAWRIVGRLFLLSPLLGLGPATYYSYTPLFNIMGYHVQFNSHNNYIDIAAQVGLLGLIAIIWFVWKLYLRLNHYLNRMPAGFSQAYMYGAFGGLVGTATAGMFGDWVIPFVYNIGMEGFRAASFAWCFLGAAVALTLLEDDGSIEPAVDIS